MVIYFYLSVTIYGNLFLSTIITCYYGNLFLSVIVHRNALQETMKYSYIYLLEECCSLVRATQV